MQKIRIQKNISQTLIYVNGLNLDIDIISWYVWNGFTYFDLEMIMPEITREYIAFSCFLKAKTTNLIWRKRWKKWANMYQREILNGCSNIPLPDSGFKHLCLPLDLIGKGGEKICFFN